MFWNPDVRANMAIYSNSELRYSVNLSLSLSVCLSLSVSLSLSLSLRFNGHFPGERGLAGVYCSKG